MRITPYQNLYRPNFKGANVSINAFSDTHGNLEKLDGFYESMKANRGDLFLEDKKGNKNILLVAGDWFISGATTGYRSDINANSNDFQIKFFNKFADKMRNLGNNAAYFIAGNHETDGGEFEFAKIIDKIKAKTIITNLDFENSPTLQKQIDKGKIVRQEIVDIEDDKNPDITHKMLILGISPINMSYYRKDMQGVNFINNPFKAEKLTTEKDYKETFNETVKLIKQFKKKNPKGLVVVGCHTGMDFAQNLAQKMGKKNINVILDAHIHKDTETTINGVKIIELSQNFEKYANVKLHIDDNGNVKDNTELSIHRPFKEEPERTGFFRKFYDKIFAKDLAKEYKIKPDKPGIKTLSDENVRVENSYLANFITDSILNEIQRTNPDADIFALNASSVRSPLETENAGGANNMQMLNVLAGIVHKDAELYKNKVSGEILMELILDNLLFNEPRNERKPLIHYSGLVINRDLILQKYHDGESFENLSKYVYVENYGRSLDLNAEYTIVNPRKYFMKSKNPLINKELFNKAEKMNLNARDLFVQHVNRCKDNLDVKCNERIID